MFPTSSYVVGIVRHSSRNASGVGSCVDYCKLWLRTTLFLHPKGRILTAELFNESK